MPDPFIAQLGRISGAMLAPNLTRAGVDLAFETDLLYLDVNNGRIGIRKDNPVYTLDLDSYVRTIDGIAANQLTVGNLLFNGPDVISTIVGPIDVFLNLSTDFIFHDRMTTSALIFNDNYISTELNQNIVFDPNGTGTVRIFADTNVTGNVNVSQNIVVTGDLSKQGNIILGDDIIDGELVENDTVTINTDFKQSIIPGADITYDLGQLSKRWAQLHVPDWTYVDNFYPGSVTISEQMLINGVSSPPKISAIQSNEDIVLNPDTGIVYIEDTKWENGDITNLLNTPLTFASTGIGYTRFMGDNAILVPAGTDAERRLTPEVGETRWNTDQGYLECFDGSVWAISTGGGEEVTELVMEDLSHVYTLMLG